MDNKHRQIVKFILQLLLTIIFFNFIGTGSVKLVSQNDQNFRPLTNNCSNITLVKHLCDPTSINTTTTIFPFSSSSPFPFVSSSPDPSISPSSLIPSTSPSKPKPTKSTIRVNSVFETSRRNTSSPSNQLGTNGKRNKISKVSVLGLFELTTRTGIRPEGYSELAAAEMAVKHINKRKLLQGYTLELLTNDTEVCIFDIKESFQ